MTERPEDVTPDETQADPVDSDITLEPESRADAAAEPAVEPEPAADAAVEPEPEPEPDPDVEPIADANPEPEPEPAADATVEAGAEAEATVEPEPAADATVEPEPEPSAGSRDPLHGDAPPTDVISPVPPTATAGPNLAWVAERASFAARARSWATEVVDPLVPAGLPLVPDGSPLVPPVLPPPSSTHAHVAPPAESDAPTETLHPYGPPRAAYAAPAAVSASPAFAAPAVAAPLPGPLGGATHPATGLSPITGLPPATASRVIQPPRSTPGAASDVRKGADEPPAGPRPHRRRRLAIVGLVAAVLVVLGGLYVGVLWLWADRVPPGTTVAGVEIGGLQGPAAVNALEDSLRVAATDPLPVAATLSESSRALT